MESQAPGFRLAIYSLGSVEDRDGRLQGIDAKTSLVRTP